MKVDQPDLRRTDNCTGSIGTGSIGTGSIGTGSIGTGSIGSALTVWQMGRLRTEAAAAAVSRIVSPIAFMIVTYTTGLLANDDSECGDPDIASDGETTDERELPASGEEPNDAAESRRRVSVRFMVVDGRDERVNS